MDNIQISVFKGFSKPLGNMPLVKKLEEIANGKALLAIEKIRLLLREGKEEEAVRIKRQLSGFTLSATYTGKRREEGITRYNDIVILDFDKLPEEVLAHCREIIKNASHTLFCFRSPSGNGLKVGVYYNSEEAGRLRKQFFGRAEVTTTELEEYHKRMFEHCRMYYEEACGVNIDTSGSDIGRLCFMSYDPEIYINHESIGQLTTPSITIIAPPPPVISTPKKKRVSAKALIANELPGDPSIDHSHIPPQLYMKFQQCINKTQRKIVYQRGQRDNYIYTLGHHCYSEEIPQEYATLLAQRQYGGDRDINIPQIIANAYHYTDQTDRKQKEDKKLVAVKVMEFLEGVCEARRNVVLENLEIRMKNAIPPDDTYRTIRKNDYNTLYVDAQFAGISCQPYIIKTIVDSRFAFDYNPFEEYFYNLPPWDEQVDYIDQQASTMKTNNKEFWHDCFKRWIVGLVACALDDERENQLALIIKGAQGKGKSSWIRRLLPPELKRHYRNGMLNPSLRDHMLLLSKCLIINLEEFEGMKKEDISDLKRLISQDSITERKAYAEQDELYIRRASFIASTNEPRFLEDITGTRRFPTVTAEKIDYRTPVEHAKMYAQALHLWKSGFQYWYDEEEFQALNAHNQQYVITSQEEELFYYYFRKPLSNDYSIKWMPVSAILTELTIWGKIQANKQTQRNLIKVLEEGTFEKRISGDKITEYKVVFIVEAR